jgi:hypothetical protein
MAEDEPDTALRLLADSLVRISGAVYRPRFRALREVLDRVLSGQGAATTLSGCLIRPGSDTALICREPGACEPMRPLVAGATVWDRRWRITAAGAWPAPARLGALGEPGLAALRAGAESGAWTPPESWASAPRAVRRTTPAIWCDTGANSGVDSGAESPVLLAAPQAGYRDQRKVGPDCTVSVENIGAGELLSPAPPTYGRAGPRDPAP